MSVSTLDMVLVHRMFGREFRDALALIADVAAGNVARRGWWLTTWRSWFRLCTTTTTRRRTS